jgi:hypothetical protein
MSDEHNKRPDNAIARTFAAQDTRGQRAWWLGNIRRNIPEIATGDDIRIIHDVFWDVPAIVIGAGPSLSKNVRLLKDVEKTHLLFCCDRAYKRVAETGVTPMFTIVADASDAVAGFFAGLDTRRTILVTPTYVSSEVLKLEWKRKIFYNVTDTDEGYQTAAVNLSKLSGKEITAIPGGVIVGNMAFIVARIAGCNPMTFIGSDLSMPEPTRNPGEILYKGIGPSGAEVWSLPGFLAGFEWILKYLRNDKDFTTSLLKVYNSTEGGIMYSEEIKGLPLKEFIEAHPGSAKSLKAALDRRFGK